VSCFRCNTEQPTRCCYIPHLPTSERGASSSRGVAILEAMHRQPSIPKSRRRLAMCHILNGTECMCRATPLGTSCLEIEGRLAVCSMSTTWFWSWSRRGTLIPCARSALLHSHALFNLYGWCGRTRCVRSGVRLLVFHMGTWGFPLGEAKQRSLYTG